MYETPLLLLSFLQLSRQKPMVEIFSIWMKFFNPSLLCLFKNARTQFCREAPGATLRRIYTFFFCLRHTQYKIFVNIFGFLFYIATFSNDYKKNSLILTMIDHFLFLLSR